MANRKGTNRPVEKARLVLEKEQFLSQLSERIKLAKATLIKASVPNIPDAYREYGYMTRKAEQNRQKNKKMDFRVQAMD